MSDLKPCPFCGNAARLTVGAHIHFAYCRTCGAGGPRGYDSMEGAVAAWNTRPGEEALRKARAEWQRAALSAEDARREVEAERDAAVGQAFSEPCCVQCFRGLSDDEQEGAHVAACNVCGKELE